MYLFNDAGTAPVTGDCVPGTAGLLENTQGTLNCAESTVSGAGKDLAVNWSITPKPAFASAAAKKLWMIGRDRAGLTSGWSQKGSWTILLSAPSVVSCSPSSVTSVAGSIQIFTTVYGHSDGVSNLKMLDLLVNSTLSGKGAIWVRYDRDVNKLFLYDDTASAYVGNCVPGTFLNLENSQGRINCAQTEVTVTDNTVGLHLSIAPKASFASPPAKSVWLRASDKGGCVTGWLVKGDWTITGAQ
jgi:hypothetical protein